MKVDLKNVLWRTRGRHWDYSFVLCPSTLKEENWYDFHAQVFARCTPGRTPYSVGGTLVSDSTQVPFVATIFLDEVRSDSAERPIANYIVWFPNSTLVTSRSIDLPPNWGAQMVGPICKRCREAFDASESSALGSDIEEVFARARKQLGAITLVGAGSQISLDMKVEINARRAVGETAVSAHGHAVQGDAANIGKLVAGAIIEGEARAIGFAGHLGTIELLRSARDKKADIARLAESFGGAITDEFIRKRVLDIDKRVTRTRLSHNPRRGFDALVDALRELPLEVDTYSEKNRRVVADLIGASSNDQVVRNLITRIVKCKTTFSRSS